MFSFVLSITFKIKALFAALSILLLSAPIRAHETNKSQPQFMNGSRVYDLLLKNMGKFRLKGKQSRSSDDCSVSLFTITLSSGIRKFQLGVGAQRQLDRSNLAYASFSGVQFTESDVVQYQVKTDYVSFSSVTFKFPTTATGIIPVVIMTRFLNKNELVFKSGREIQRKFEFEEPCIIKN